MRFVLRFSAWLVLCAPLGLSAQVDSVQLRYAATINQADLKDYLTVLASDEYEGRETGARGQKMAAKYIREHFMAFGIPPVPAAEERGLSNGYEQPFPLALTRPGGLSLLVDGKPIGFMQEFFYLSEKLQEDYTTDSIIYGGYGDKPIRKDLKGKTLLVLEDGLAGVTKADRPPAPLTA
jgi:hypothetical protein